MHGRVLLGVGKGILFREVSSVQGCPHRQGLHCISNESTEVQNPRRNSYTQTMDVCITPCTVDISVDSPALFVG